jgi:hypothetical protein
MLRPLTNEEIALGTFVLAMQRPDGSFQTFLQDEPTDRDEMFYSGEALTALARLAAVSDDPVYDSALEKGLAYYRKKIREDFWPQYTPWHMQAYAIAYENDPRPEYAEYVFWLADSLIETMLERDPEARPEEEGRFYNPARAHEWGVVHSASTGIYTEGLAYSLELAENIGDARKGRYREALLRGTQSLLTVQWTPESAYYILRPERVVGSFKLSVVNNIGRVDQTGHAANALARIRELVQ